TFLSASWAPHDDGRPSRKGFIFQDLRRYPLQSSALAHALLSFCQPSNGLTLRYPSKRSLGGSWGAMGTPAFRAPPPQTAGAPRFWARSFVHREHALAIDA